MFSRATPLHICLPRGAMTDEDWDEYKKKSHGWSIRMGFELLHSDAYRELNYAPAIKVLNWFYEKVKVEVNKGKRGKDRYRIVNDGLMSFCYDEAKFRGIEHRKFARALKELVHYGFIDIKRHGSGMKGDYSEFSLSERWRNWGISNFQVQEMPSTKATGFRKERQTKGVNCEKCIQKKYVGNDGLIQCCHPEIEKITSQYPDRKPGVHAAMALSLMRKNLEVKIDSGAYRNPWFNWPFCFAGKFIESCFGFKKLQRQKTDVTQRH